MFRHRQQLRQWAARVLLLWLFGVFAGVANACLAPAVMTLPDGHVAAGASSLEVTHHEVGLVGVGHHGESAWAQDAGGTLNQQDSAAKSNCLDFCDKASISLPPLKSALDAGQGHAPVLPTASIVVPMPAFEPVLLQVPRRDGVGPLSIPIAFLRLAL